MEITGTIIKIMPVKSGTSQATGKEWSSQDFVVEMPTDNPQYPERAVFTLFGAEKINEAQFRNGDDVTVSFHLNAKEYKDKWYNALSAWKIERTTIDHTPNPAPQEAPSAQTNTMVGDLPF